MNSNQKRPPAWGPSIIGLILVGLLATPAPILAEQVTYTYDNLNRLTHTDYGNGRAIEYTYDAAGNRLSQVVTVPDQNQAPTANREPERGAQVSSLTATALPAGAASR